MRIDKVISFLKEEFPIGTQVFNSRNLVGDDMDNVYEADGITVDYCANYDYIEVFGVTEDEYDKICEALGETYWNGEYEGF